MLPSGRSKLTPRHAPISSSSSPAASCPLYAVFVFILCQWNREWFFQGGRLYARRLAYIMVYYIINAIEWINWLKQFYNLSKHVHDQQQLRACAVLGVPRWSLDIGHWTWLAMMASWDSKRSGLFVPLESAARQDELALLWLLLVRVSFAVNWFALLHCWRPQISSSSSLCTIYIKTF